MRHILRSDLYVRKYVVVCLFCEFEMVYTLFVLCVQQEHGRTDSTQQLERSSEYLLQDRPRLHRGLEEPVRAPLKLFPCTVLKWPLVYPLHAAIMGFSRPLSDFKINLFPLILLFFCHFIPVLTLFEVPSPTPLCCSCSRSMS